MFLFGFILVAGATLLGGLSLYLTEGPLTHTSSPINDLGNDLWWALVTLTTVGYGDITPVTGVGRAIGGALMVAGMFTIALFAGIISQTLLRAVLSIREEQFRMSTYVNHLVVCGYDPSARMLLDALLAEGDCSGRTVVLFAEGERPSTFPTTSPGSAVIPQRRASSRRSGFPTPQPSSLSAVGPWNHSRRTHGPF